MLSGVYSYASLLMPHCPVTVVQSYRDGVCSLLFHSFFIICHPYIPLHLEDFFYTCYTAFLVVPMHHLQYRCKKKICIIHATIYNFLLHYLPSLLIPCSLFVFFFVMQHAGIELGPHRYDATVTEPLRTEAEKGHPVLPLFHCVRTSILPSCYPAVLLYFQSSILPTEGWDGPSRLPYLRYANSLVINRA